MKVNFQKIISWLVSVCGFDFIFLVSFLVNFIFYVWIFSLIPKGTSSVAYIVLAVMVSITVRKACMANTAEARRVVYLMLGLFFYLYLVAKCAVWVYCSIKL